MRLVGRKQIAGLLSALVVVFVVVGFVVVVFVVIVFVVVVSVVVVFVVVFLDFFNIINPNKGGTSRLVCRKQIAGLLPALVILILIPIIILIPTLIGRIEAGLPQTNRGFACQPWLLSLLLSLSLLSLSSTSSTLLVGALRLVCRKQIAGLLSALGPELQPQQMGGDTYKCERHVSARVPQIFLGEGAKK